MHPFWKPVIEPVLDAAGADTVIEIGAEQGRTTALLLDRARRRGRGVVHAIDPAPRFDVSAWELEWGQLFRFHRGRSLDLLAGIGSVDAVLVDGDHNYYTVSGELDLLDQAAAAAVRPLPLVLAHDVGWPYGRRDLYYDPEAVPREHRHDAARAGILPGRDELGQPGINSGLWNATREGGPGNGVMTAIEDFVSGRTEPCLLVTVEGLHGLAVIASESRLAASPALAASLERLETAQFLREWIGLLENARVMAEIRAGQSAASAEARQLHRVDRDRGLLE
jgi:hypothetical protein